MLCLTALGFTLIGCDQYNVGVRSFYGVESNNYKRVEAGIIQLYRKGVFQTNSDTSSSPTSANNSARHDQPFQSRLMDIEPTSLAPSLSRTL
jgi:hypothetical protein